MGTALFWFRRDLRLADQPALTAACAAHERVLPLCFHTGEEAAANAWRQRAITTLADTIAAGGGMLLQLQEEAPIAMLLRLVHETGAVAVYASRIPEPGQAAFEAEATEALHSAGCALHLGPANLMFAPGAIAKADGGPYRVFTPFWRTCLQQPWPRPAAEPALHRLARWPEDMRLRWHRPPPALQGWQAAMLDHWPADGQQRLHHFLDTVLAGYATGRDLPGCDGTSMLSPWLHSGELGVVRLAAEVRAWATEGETPAHDAAATAFLRQLGWREFAHQLLHAFPHTIDQPLDGRFDRFAWQPDSDLQAAWQRGETGIPIVDAGMRQLWATGWMHNRVRMLAASLLTKNLLQPWQAGAAWFMQTLVDADIANNTLGWQWVAGCGADAAPYFRIFNPVSQGERFDADGGYVRLWLPELARLPDEWLHRPWQAPTTVLRAVGIRPGKAYPLPICDLQASRREALGRFQQIKGEKR